MAIEVRLFASLRTAVGHPTVTYEQTGDRTIREILAMLEADYPALEGRLLDEAGIAESLVVMVNGRPVTHLDGERTLVGESAEIAISLPISGGIASR